MIVKEGQILLPVRIHITTGRSYVLTILIPTTGHVTAVSFYTFLPPTVHGDHGHPARSGGIAIRPEHRAGIGHPLAIISDPPPTLGGSPVQISPTPDPPGQPKASPVLVVYLLAAAWLTGGKEIRVGVGRGEAQSAHTAKLPSPHAPPTSHLHILTF